MGIVNVTHDSFFSSSRAFSVEEALERATRMVREGAAILDVGGESTRPGSDPVSADEETRRVLPVIEALTGQFPDIPISIDTRKAAVAEAALDAGASIVNDVSALAGDPEMAALVAERGVPIVLMHMRGTPKTMQKNPHYDDAPAEVRAELLERVAAAHTAGIRDEQIILDPGIGFGKRFEDNWALLANLDELTALPYPVLVGLSRKSFLGEVAARGLPGGGAGPQPSAAAPRNGAGPQPSGPGGPLPPEERLPATTAAHLWCTLHGVDILRVHDVAAARQAVQVAAAIADAIRR